MTIMDKQCLYGIVIYNIQNQYQSNHNYDYTTEVVRQKERHDLTYDRSFSSTFPNVCF